MSERMPLNASVRYVIEGTHESHDWRRLMGGLIEHPKVCIRCLAREDRPAAEVECDRLREKAADRMTNPTTTLADDAEETK